MLARIKYLFLCSQTLAIRFWTALAGIGFGLVMLAGEVLHHTEYALMIRVAPPEVWGLLFMLNAAAILFGVVSRKYSTVQLLLEPVLGFALWGTAAASFILIQGTIGPSFVAALVQFWLLVRYPTHREWSEGRAD